MRTLLYVGLELSEILPLFHAFTGCDTVSSFNGRGKITAFDALKSFPSTVEGFRIAAKGNVDDAMPILEKFVVTMYDKYVLKIIVSLQYCPAGSVCSP